MKSIKPIEKYYQWLLNDGIIKFELEDDWLTVSVKTPKSATPSKDGYEYTLVCAQPLYEYKRPITLVNRINFMLALGLASSRQDVKIFYQEWQQKGGR